MAPFLLTTNRLSATQNGKIRLSKYFFIIPQNTAKSMRLSLTENNFGCLPDFRPFPLHQFDISNKYVNSF